MIKVEEPSVKIRIDRRPVKEGSPLLLSDEEWFNLVNTNRIEKKTGMVGEFKKKNLSESVGSSVFCLDCKALENLEIATDIRFLENLKIATGIRFHQVFTHPTK